MASSRIPRAALVTGLASRSAGSRCPGRPSGVARAGLALALVITALGASSFARAELDLSWKAPPGCPDRAQVLARIREIAGAALDDDVALSVQATITRKSGRSRLELLVRDGPRVERRVITSDSCTALAGAAAVTLTLLLRAGDAATGDEADARDPSAGGDSETALPGAADAQPAGGDQLGAELPGERSEPEIEDIDADASRPAEIGAERSWALIVRPYVAADVGPLPRPALGVGVGIGVRVRRWSFSVSGQYSRAQNVDSVVRLESSGAELERLSGQLLTCNGWRWTTLEVSPCVGVTLEHVTARGFGEGVSPQARRAVWPAPGFAVVAHWHTLQSLALFATLGAYLELSRPRFVITDLGEVEQLGPASLSATLGMEWIL